MASLARRMKPTRPWKSLASAANLSLKSSGAAFTTSRSLRSMADTSKDVNVHNAWVGEKGPGGWDLRSDVATTPTASMLAAIQNCTLRDDVFGEDETTINLEAYVAQMAGKEAGLFVTSGSQGNQVALRSLLTQPPYGILCDHRSHIIKYEAGGISSFSGAMPQTVVPANRIHLTLQDVTANVVLGDDIHACPTRVISMENTLNGMIAPLDEVRKIAAFAKEHDIKMHCDGARLWEAVAAGAGTLPELAACFDTISLCFSKGLGAPVGSMIVGSRETIKHCRWVRKMIGGGMRQPGFITAAARVAVDETFGKTADGQSGWLRTSHEMAKKVEALWTELGGTLVHPAHTNMCWLDLEAAHCSAERFAELGKEAGLTLGGGRLVTHYQVAQNGQDVLGRLAQVFSKVFGESDGSMKDRVVGQDNMYKLR